MNSKYKFGITEVVAMIIGSLLIVMLDLFFRNNNLFHADTIKSALVVVFAVFFGSPAGVVTAIASSLLLAAILKLDVSITAVIAYVLIALLVGHYSQEFGIRDGLFKGKKIWIFAVAKLAAEIFAWMFFWPLVNFILTRGILYDVLGQKVKTVLMLTALDAIIIPVFILISYLISKRNDKYGLQQL